MPVVVTARRMADAIEYLIRVARRAGLWGVAGKLGVIRVNLLNVAAGEPEEQAGKRDTSTIQGEDAGDERHKQH